MRVIPAHQVWIARAGRTVRATLIAWGRQAHVRVFWHTNEDWPIVAPATFTGSFTRAVHGFLVAVDGEGIDLRGRLFSNHVLVVTATQTDQSAHNAGGR